MAKEGSTAISVKLQRLHLSQAKIFCCCIGDGRKRCELVSARSMIRATRPGRLADNDWTGARAVYLLVSTIPTFVLGVWLTVLRGLLLARKQFLDRYGQHEDHAQLAFAAASSMASSYNGVRRG